MQEELSSGVSRRGVLNWLFGGWLAAFFAAVVYPIVRYILPPRTPEPTVTSVVAGTVDELPPNSGKIFRFGSRPGIVIRTPDGEIRAFSAVCTHLQCTVQYRPDLKHIWCACHNGHYDLNGRNIAGPPPRPLERYDVKVAEDGSILVFRRPQEA